jgi:hypothetical protein
LAWRAIGCGVPAKRLHLAQAVPRWPGSIVSSAWAHSPLTACSVLRRFPTDAPRHRGARGIDRRAAQITVERDLPCWCQVKNVDGLSLRVGVADLDRGVAEDGVLPDDRAARLRRQKDPVGVAGDRVQFDLVTARRANDADTKIIGRFSVAITTCFIQPDPAVVADDSYTPAGGSRIRRAIADRQVPLHDGLERGSENVDAAAAVGRHGQVVDSGARRPGH